MTRTGSGPLVHRQILKNRYFWLATMLLALLVGVLLVAAPATSRLDSGSTWSRAPAGYSAWFESLADGGIQINRWQRPVSQLIDLLNHGPENLDGTSPTLIQHSAAPGQTNTPATLVVVLPDFFEAAELPGLVPWLPAWLEAGHRLVVLGVKTPATAAPFNQTLDSPFGDIDIQTRRRYEGSLPTSSRILADDYGTVIWRDEGELFYRSNARSGDLFLVGTPFLAANAYLDAPGNFALLTDLVTRHNGQIWVDEYLHGYRDLQAEGDPASNTTWISYIAQTPWLVFGVQALIVVLLAILALNRRLGHRLTVTSPPVDNSRAYIDALAGVLRKANSHGFVVQTISQAERMALQKALGLGGQPVSDEQLTAAWQQQTDAPAADLAPIVAARAPRQEDQLKAWLQQLQSVHQFIPTRTPGHE